MAWLKANFGDDVIHARADRDEAAYHVHAVMMPPATVEIVKPRAKVPTAAATRRMLQPSIHPLIEDYEAAQDSVGLWFLDPALAASKPSRKKRQQAEEAPDTAATARAMATLRHSLNKQVKTADNEERLRDKVIGDTMSDFIAAMDEEVLAPFFFSLERLATAPNRRRIASHSFRPEIVDEMHVEADEEEAAEADMACKADTATKEARRAKDPCKSTSPKA